MRLHPSSTPRDIRDGYFADYLTQGSRPVKIRKIEATVDLKINLGHYETMTEPITLKADLEDGDDPDKCAAELYAQATKIWAKEMLKKLRFVRAYREDKTKFDLACEKTIAELKKLVVSK